MQIGSITTTGHSLGGALAALCAADIADCLNGTPEAKAAPMPERRAWPLPKQLKRLKSQPAAAFADLAATAIESTHTVIECTQRAAACAAHALSDQAEVLYEETEGAIGRFRGAMKEHLARHSIHMPPVTAVTFGAPRVGDKNFAAKFGMRMCVPPPAHQQLWLVLLFHDLSCCLVTVNVLAINISQ